MSFGLKNSLDQQTVALVNNQVTIQIEDKTKNIINYQEYTNSDIILNTIPYVIITILNGGNVVLPTITYTDIGKKINITNSTNHEITIIPGGDFDMYYGFELEFNLPSKMSLKILAMDENTWFNLNG